MASLERATRSSCFAKPGPFPKTQFAIGQKSAIPDAVDRQRRLASIISQEIIPRLMLIHHQVLTPCEREPNGPSQREIEDLAHLVLGPDVQAATNYILRLRQRGLPLDVLYIELLEPAARLLGKMWDDDRCDFVDVTLGVARLQELLAIFNDTNCVSAFGDMRRAITATTSGEQHRFGLAVVEKFLRASGWHVRSESGASLDTVAATVQSEWFAVAGVTLSCETRLDVLAALIKTIREHSCNKNIGVMVGGPVFNGCPELALRVGADAVAVNAPTAVLLAQKLFDLGVVRRAQAFNGSEAPGLSS
jgi:MerR family transcriptional regulator, light-induced transcriptional regulator